MNRGGDRPTGHNWPPLGQGSGLVPQEWTGLGHKWPPLDPGSWAYAPFQSRDGAQLATPGSGVGTCAPNRTPYEDAEPLDDLSWEDGDSGAWCTPRRTGRGREPGPGARWARRLHGRLVTSRSEPILSLDGSMLPMANVGLVHRSCQVLAGLLGLQVLDVGCIEGECPVGGDPDPDVVEA